MSRFTHYIEGDLVHAIVHLHLITMRNACSCLLVSVEAAWQSTMHHMSRCGVSIEQVFACWLQDNVAAALAMQIAHEMDPTCQYHTQDLERLMRRIPTVLADTLEVRSPSKYPAVLESAQDVDIHRLNHQCNRHCSKLSRYVDEVCSYRVTQPMMMPVTQLPLLWTLGLHSAAVPIPLLS